MAKEIIRYIHPTRSCITVSYIPLLAKYPLEFVQKFSSFLLNTFLCLVRQHAMKAYGEVEVYFHSFLASKLDKGVLRSMFWSLIT